MQLDPQKYSSMSPSVMQLLESRSRINSVFKELAIHETTSIDDTMAAMLDLKLREVREQRPDLSEVEVYAVAGRLLKQLILCYKSALDQLLP